MTLHLIFSLQKSLSIWVLKNFFSLPGGGDCQANHRTGWELRLAAVTQTQEQNSFGGGEEGGEKKKCGSSPAALLTG